MVSAKLSQVYLTSPLDRNLLNWGRGKNDVDLTWPFILAVIMLGEERQAG